MSATVHGPGQSNDIQQFDEPDCRLYLISPPKFELRTFYAQLEEAFDAGNIGCFQLRMKDVSDDIIIGAAETLMPLAREREIPFLINDSPTLAAETGADGVHIGQDDASYEEARSILGADAIIGVTCHDSRHLAVIAAEKGADYVAFGAFFPTTTKQASSTAGTDLVRWWCDTTIVQCVGIGGITVENCAPVIAAGADFLAVSAGIWDYPTGPGEAVKAFEHKILHTPREDPVI